MRLVSSFEDFLNNLQDSGNDIERFIPIVLIRPSTIIHTRDVHSLDPVLDYYDVRTGVVQFYLPGYVQIPGMTLRNLFQSVRCSRYRPRAFNIQRLGNVGYSNQSFSDFVEVLEREIPGYHYNGDTELIFARYIPGNGNCPGQLDYSNYRCYNLSTIFFNNGYRELGHFLEQTLKEYKQRPNDNDMLAAIDRFYRPMTRRMDYGE